MEKVIFDFKDLVPEDASLQLSTLPGKTLTLAAYTLAKQLWAVKNIGEPALVAMVTQNALEPAARLGWYLLKEKELFKGEEDFFEHVSSYKDRNALYSAVLHTIGMSQPVRDKLAEEEAALKRGGQELKKENPEATEPTGQNTTTS